MRLIRTRQLLPRVDWLDSVDSTNAALRGLCAHDGESVLHGTMIATANQISGRGRLGRRWVTPPSTALAASLLVRGDWSELTQNEAKDHDPLPMSWLPLLAGSAVAATLQPLFRPGDASVAKRVGVKWPNDVHVRDEADAEAGNPGKKLCGILCEVVPGETPAANAVIVGMGINLLIPDWQLPTERATSVLAAGGDVGDADDLDDDAGQDLADRVLAGVAAELLRLCEQARSDPNAVRTRVLRHSLTLGTEVRVHLPGGEIVDGRASALDADGSLVVDLPTGGQLQVSAADVEHLR